MIKNEIFKRFVVFKKKARNRLNHLRFGHEAPQSDSLRFVDPWKVRQYCPNRKLGAPKFRRQDSGRIVSGDWDRSVTDWSETNKHKNCVARFVEGKTWQETGIVDQMLTVIEREGVCDGCRSLDEILARYESLDRLFEEVSKTGRLLSRQEQDRSQNHERDGIFVHFDRFGIPLRSGGGGHRFAIALICGLQEIPVQVGVVHTDCVRSESFSKIPRVRNLGNLT